MKNIVAITFDSLRADHCGYNGYERDTTPNMDALANDGIAFTKAVSPASRTNPSMASIFTGELMVTRDKVSNPENSKYHLKRYGTLAQDLSEKGYITGAFCPNAYASRYYGFDRGFDFFEDFLFSTEQYQKLFNKHISDSGAYTALRNIRNLLRKEEAFRTWDTYIDDMEDWVNQQDQPFFLWAFSLDTHFPYITPRGHRKWSDSLSTYYYNWRCNKLLDQFNVELSKEDENGISNIYDDSIQFADKLIGELQDRIGGKDTIFVVFADHGEAIGEHGFYGHFYPSLYEENIHVPLVIGGDIETDEIITRPVSLTNLPEIINELAETGDLQHTHERVVSSTYDGRRNRNLISTRLGPYKILFEKNDTDTIYRCYNLEEDPEESTNLVESHPDLVKELKELVFNRYRHEDELLAIREGASQIPVTLGTE